MSEVAPPPLRAPSSKERKYDRQLRLWAASGQAAIEDSHLLLVNSGSGVVGVETLKNLVLPGIGQFTLLDPANVCEADLGVNFFLENEDLGKSRAVRCAHWLQELNPDVTGRAIQEPLDSFFSKEDALLPYTLILVTLPLPSSVLETISRTTQSLSIPLFCVHSLGAYSHFTLQLPKAFPIIDTHPDPATTTDLRLLEPWPELAEYSMAKTVDLEHMEDDIHGHVPYVLLLLRYLEDFKRSHDGKPPQNYSQKTEFRGLVKRGARTDNAEGGEENFDEAASAILRSTLNPAVPSSAVMEVFEADECVNLNQESPSFWIIAQAIREFLKKHGVLPLSGGLPDMKAKSADYMELQNLYKSKARKDAGEVLAKVREIEESLNPLKSISVSEVDVFCKNSGYVKLVRGRPCHLAQPSGKLKWNDRAMFAANALRDPESLILIYIAFLAYDICFARHENDCKIGQDKHSLEEDEVTGSAESLIDSLVEEAGASMDESEISEAKEKVGNIVSELVRAEGGELHNISALTGGMVAQEVIKVITKQYIPTDNTCIFDGIFSKSSVLRL